MGETAVLKAIENKDPKALAKALAGKGGAKSANARGSLERTALINAAQVGELECVELLLSAGADVNLVDIKGQSALHFAARFGKAPCARALIKAGANIEAPLESGPRPLRLALSSLCIETVMALVDAGADTVAFDSKGKTLMEIAGEHKQRAKELASSRATSASEKYIKYAEALGALAEACELRGHTESGAPLPSRLSGPLAL